VSLGFSPIHPRGPYGRGYHCTPAAQLYWSKMLQLGEVIGGWLEVEGCVLAEVIVEHVLLRFHSRDP
jgi:hypothetical protein